jgi:CHAD domain-containing protein
MPFHIDRIKKASRKVRKFIERNRKTPTSKAIHDLRTSTSSLETAFTTLHLDKKSAVKNLLQELGGVRRRAGKVRDMDVLTEDLLSMRLNGDRDCQVQLVEYLGAKRDKHAGKLHRKLEEATRHLVRDLKRQCGHLEAVLKKAEESPSSNAVSASMTTTLQLASELQKPARLTRGNLHPYRLKVKQLRNVLQLSANTGDSELFDKLGEVKDAIGEWHDSEELVRIATKLLNHGPRCRLMKLLKTTSDERFEHALSLTKQLRKKYLKAGMSQGGTPSAVSRDVVEATSSIAQHSADQTTRYK